MRTLTGCGTGRACLTAAISIGSMFTNIRGIEIVPELIRLADIAKSRYIFGLTEADKRIKVNNRNARNLHLMTLNSTSKKKVNNDVKTVEENPELQKRLKDMTIEMLSSSIDQQLQIDTLANAICKAMGHKDFKVAVKPWKSFARYLKQSETIVSVNESNTIATLIQQPEETLEAVSNSVVIDETNSITLAEIEMSEDMESLVVEEVADDPEVMISKLIDIIKTEDNLSAILPIPDISLEVGDIFANDWWSDCYVAYAASLLFTPEMMSQLVHCVGRMRIGSWFISLKPLPLDELGDEVAKRISLQHETFFKMSWQMAKVYIYKII